MPRIKSVDQFSELAVDPIIGAILVDRDGVRFGPSTDDGLMTSVLIDSAFSDRLQDALIRYESVDTRKELLSAKRSNAVLIVNEMDGTILLNSNGPRPGLGPTGGLVLAVPTPINGQITDAVTQLSIQVLREGPFARLSNIYESWAHSTGGGL